ncbi:MAG: tetratricopeptide repeat protein [Aridibacter famidurans]|nr:tetratricopeptide repeat protein [Aridibacter famidurans]
MNKDNILFAIVGLLAGLIVGFMGANYINKNAAPAPGTLGANQMGLPPDHPAVQGQADPAAMQDVQAAIDAAEKQPDDFDSQVKAAELFFRIQRYDDAIKYYSRANEIRPDDYQVIVNLGNANFDASKFLEAEKWYASALEKKADDVNVRTDMGLTFLLRDPKDVDRAIAEFVKSLEYDPKHALTLQNLVVAYTEKKDAAKATETLTRLEEVSPGNEVIPRLREAISKTSAPTQGSE